MCIHCQCWNLNWVIICFRVDIVPFSFNYLGTLRVLTPLRSAAWFIPHVTNNKTPQWRRAKTFCACARHWHTGSDLMSVLNFKVRIINIWIKKTPKHSDRVISKWSIKVKLSTSLLLCLSLVLPDLWVTLIKPINTSFFFWPLERRESWPHSHSPSHLLQWSFLHLMC